MPTRQPTQTLRLILRPLHADDVPLLYAIQSDAAAMRFTYCAPSLEACSHRLWKYEAMRTSHGFAPWVVLDRSDAKLIGWGGLGVDPLDPDWGPEISYFFHPAYWGRGLATELVAHCIEHAFHTLALSEVSAFAMPENVASIRVLEKSGFTFLRYEPSLARNHYRISADRGVLGSPSTGRSR